MRLGVFGGTFDPVHLAHLALAEQCREQGGLDRVLFIPAPRPPHKPDRVAAPFHHRVEMLELAIAGYPAFAVDQMEKDRPGPSFTADTLRELRERQPENELFLLVGSDCLPYLPTWHETAQIAALATLLVAERPNWSLAAEIPPAFRAQRIQMPLLDISSRDLRRRISEGRSIRYLVPRAVECYIQQHGLYRAGIRD
jgi:nicotinate-nucleotide adenylyltransferase